MTAPTAREEAALRVDPWGDGKGDDCYRVFRNAIVIAAMAAYSCDDRFESLERRYRIGMPHALDGAIQFLNQRLTDAAKAAATIAAKGRKARRVGGVD